MWRRTQHGHAGGRGVTSKEKAVRSDNGQLDAGRPAFGHFDLKRDWPGGNGQLPTHDELSKTFEQVTHEWFREEISNLLLGVDLHDLDVGVRVIDD